MLFKVISFSHTLTLSGPYQHFCKALEDHNVRLYIFNALSLAPIIGPNNWLTNILLKMNKLNIFT